MHFNISFALPLNTHRSTRQRAPSKRRRSSVGEAEEETESATTNNNRRSDSSGSTHRSSGGPKPLLPTSSPQDSQPSISSRNLPPDSGEAAPRLSESLLPELSLDNLRPLGSELDKEEERGIKQGLEEEADSLEEEEDKSQGDEMEEENKTLKVELFHVVTEALSKTASVGWDNAVDSLHLAYDRFSEAEAQTFLHAHLEQIVGILLDQVAHRIDIHQRSCVDNSLRWALNIIILALERQQEEFLPTLLMIFNRKRTFYKAAGAGGYWGGAGPPNEVRLRLIGDFMENGGFDLLCRTLRAKKQGWMGCENFRILLQAAFEGREVVATLLRRLAPNNPEQAKNLARLTEGVVEEVALCLREPLSTLAEEDLKLEPALAVSALAEMLRKRLQDSDDEVDRDALMQSWLALAHAHIRSSSLPLRLSAWEQMGDIIRIASSARPIARRYRVKGAGEARANGIYDFVRERNGAPEYQHQAGDGTVLTLFRCLMRCKEKWWFISEADNACPGTDQDVDYYQHRSIFREQDEPHPVGWLVCSSGTSKGKAPAPTVERLEPLCDAGQEEASLEHRVLQWAIENRVLEDVFGPSMHREVVIRAGGLLKLMANMKGLTDEHLERIWRASIGQPETELVEEIHAALAALIPLSLTPPLTIRLFDTIQKSICAQNAVLEALAFVEKLALDLKVQDLLALHGPEGIDSLLRLLWEVLQHPGTRSQKGVRVTRDLFAKSLQVLPGTERQTAFLKQCLRTIQLSATTYGGGVGQKKGSTVALPILNFGADDSRRTSQHQHKNVVNEDEVINALQMAQFLLEVFPATDLAPALQRLAVENHLPELLFQELKTFKQRALTGSVASMGSSTSCIGSPQSSSLPASVSTVVFNPSNSPTPALPTALLLDRVKMRLDVIRYVHSHSETVKLSFPQLMALWDVLDSPAEKELFLLFLSEACLPRDAGTSSSKKTAAGTGESVNAPESCQKGKGLVPLAFSPTVMWTAFRDIVCQRADWTGLGDQAYGCFNAYFTGLRQWDRDAGDSQEYKQGSEEEEEEKKVDEFDDGILLGRSGVDPKKRRHQGQKDDLQHESTLAVALDALWRIALTARTQSVADAATRDLLSVYSDTGTRQTDRDEDGKGTSTGVVASTMPDPSMVTASEATSPTSLPASMPNTCQRRGRGKGGNLVELRLHFLERVFGSLDACRVELSSRNNIEASASVDDIDSRKLSKMPSEPSKQSQDTILRAERCLRLIQGAIGFNGVILGCISDDAVTSSSLTPVGSTLGAQSLAHGVRGQAGRLLVVVEPRRMIPSQTTVRGGLSTSTGGGAQRLEPISILMHPLETVGVLRRRVAVRCQHPVEQVRLVVPGMPKQLNRLEMRFGSLGLAEGADVNAVLFSKSLNHSGHSNPGSSIVPHSMSQPQSHHPPPLQPAGDTSGEISPMVVEGAMSIQTGSKNLEGGASAEHGNVSYSAPTDLTTSQSSVGVKDIYAASTMKASAPPAIGDMIATNEKYCHILFDLLECCSSHSPSVSACSSLDALGDGKSVGDKSNAALMKNIWELLLVLPTQKHALQMVRQAAMQPAPSSVAVCSKPCISAEASSSPSWSSLISTKAWHRSVYNMQVIDAFLQPSEDALHEDDSVPPEDFHAAFLKTGGFTHVLDVLMRTSVGGNTFSDCEGDNGSHVVSKRDEAPVSVVQWMATAVSLRIVKFFLFGQQQSRVRKGESVDESSATTIRGTVSVPARSASEGPPSETSSSATMEMQAAEALPGKMLGPDEHLGGGKRVRQLLNRLVQVAAQAHEAAVGGTEHGKGEETCNVSTDALATIELLLRRSGVPANSSGSNTISESGATTCADGSVNQTGQIPTTNPIAAFSCNAITNDLVSALVTHNTAPSLFIGLLLRNPHRKVRQQTRDLILGPDAPLLRRSVFTWCLSALEMLEVESVTCLEFFDVLQELSSVRKPPLAARPNSAGNSAPVPMVLTSELSGVSEEMSTVIAPTPPTGGGDDLVQALAQLVTRRLVHYPRISGSRSASVSNELKSEEGGQSAPVLLGLLRLLNCLVEQDHDGSLLAGTVLGDLIGKAFADFLFAVPSLRENNAHGRPICAAGEAKCRQLVFSSLLTRAKQCSRQMESILGQVMSLTEAAASGLRDRWQYEYLHETKSYPGQYVGLRNQGCTCYMNSLLQQLFMVPRLRDAILAARVKRRRMVSGEMFRDEELIGRQILVDWETEEGTVKMEATVTSFDGSTGKHTIKYDGAGGANGNEKINASVRLKLREGRAGKETGHFQVIPPRLHSSLSAVREVEQAQRVLEQMQRTFCYLSGSEKRYFDPRFLVEACRCLNLNYSVYQQNDASEFCDKLLDQLEASLKGTPQLVDLEEGCFGGKLAYQKLPQGCEHRAEREEPFIKIELIIKGKESIEESLAAFVEGELMDGENKVECEGCNTKKPTVRRICLGSLPNLLILHLKRFDLDFTTFETVKLNNRCAFPTRLNMKPYTREGLEEASQTEALQKLQVRENGEDMDVGLQEREERKEGMTVPASLVNDVPMVFEDEEFDYELKGVVIHAGIAQGGHYYSFIKDREREDTWHKFDDEDVTSFDPSLIETQCFGGTFSKPTTWNGVTNYVEQERVHNALMLFYEKVRPRGRTSSLASAQTDGHKGREESCAPMEAVEDVEKQVAGEVSRGTGSADESAMTVDTEGSKAMGNEKDDFEYGLDGRAAFEEEVWHANVAFIYHRYIFDPQFHSFLSSLLTMVFCPSSPSLLAPTSSGASMETGEAECVWNPLAPEMSSVRQEVFGMGLAFLLDVMLHSRDRLGVQSWMNLLRHAMQVDPDMASWLLEALILTPPPVPLPSWKEARRSEEHLAEEQSVSSPRSSWLRTYFLECSDCTARACVLQLLVSAIARLAREDVEVRALQAASLTEARNHSRIARFLEAAGQLLHDANRHWLHVDELFSLFRDAARASEPVRLYLVRADFAFYLAMFVLGAAATPSLKSQFPYASSSHSAAPAMSAGATTGPTRPCPSSRSEEGAASPLLPLSPVEGIAPVQQVNPPHAVTDYLYLMEAIATLVGFPQAPKAALLEEWEGGREGGKEEGEGGRDGGVASYYPTQARLTQAAREALTTIFQENSRAGGMSMQDLSRYLEKCASLGGGGGGIGGGRHGGGVGAEMSSFPLQQQVSHATLKSILAKYEKGNDNRLTLNGFLDYYRDQAQWLAKQVWHDLQASGFGNDLRRHGGRGRGRDEEVEKKRAVEEMKGEEGREEPGKGAGQSARIGTGKEETLQLPAMSRLALGMLAFYAPMYEVFPTETTGILQRVVREDMALSRCLINQMLAEFHRLFQPLATPLSSPSTLQQQRHELHQAFAPSGLSSNPISLQTLACCLCALYNVKDSLEMERLKEILWGEGLGLLSSLLDKFGGGEQRATRRQLLAGQSFFKQAVDPLLREMLKLCDSLHSRMSMVPGKEQSFALLQSLVAEGEEEIDDGGRDAGNGAYSRRESVGEGGGARRRNGGRKEGRMLSASEGEEEEDDDEEDEEEEEEEEEEGLDDNLSVSLPPPTCRLEGAGIEDVNGSYMLMPQKVNGAYLYTKKTDKILSDGTSKVYTLYRCEIDAGEVRWYVSIVPPGGSPGTQKDIDFYYATCPGGRDDCRDGYYGQHGTGKEERRRRRPRLDPLPVRVGWRAIKDAYLAAPTLVFEGQEEDEEDGLDDASFEGAEEDADGDDEAVAVEEG